MTTETTTTPQQSPVPNSDSKNSDSKNSDSKNSGSERQSTSDLEELSERLRGTDGKHGDLSDIIANNWQKLLGSLAVVLLTVALIGEYRSAENRKIGEASLRFEDARSSLDNPDILREKLRVLTTGHSDSLYGKIAPLYAASADIQTKDFDKARERLAQFDLGIVNGTRSAVLDEEITPEEFVNELASLMYLRMLVAEKKTEKAKLAELIGNLVSGAKFVNLEALIMLFRLANTEEERKNAQAAATELVSSRPTLRETARVELGNLGIGLE